MLALLSAGCGDANISEPGVTGLGSDESSTTSMVASGVDRPSFDYKITEDPNGLCVTIELDEDDPFYTCFDDAPITSTVVMETIADGTVELIVRLPPPLDATSLTLEPSNTIYARQGRWLIVEVPSDGRIPTVRYRLGEYQVECDLSQLDLCARTPV